MCFLCSTQVNTRQKACGREMGAEYRHQGWGTQISAKGEAASVIRKVLEIGRAYLGDRNYQSCPVDALLSEINSKR